MPSEKIKDRENQPRKGSYFVRHWRGELSLAKSFWLDDVALGVVVFFGTGFLLGILAFEFHQQPGLAVVLIVSILFVGICTFVWSLIGLWRSACNYAGRRIWSVLARLVTVVWLGLVGLSWITASQKLITTYYNCTTGRDFGELLPFFDPGPCEVAWYPKSGLVVRRLARTPYGVIERFE
jgi:hypothetical protein